MYANDLDSGAAFFGTTLGMQEVKSFNSAFSFKFSNSDPFQYKHKTRRDTTTKHTHTHTHTHIQVEHLVQKDKCRIFHSTFSPSGFIAVCNTREAPVCSVDSTGNSVPVTYTFVVANRSMVESAFRRLLPLNTSKLTITQPHGRCVRLKTSVGA